MTPRKVELTPGGPKRKGRRPKGEMVVTGERLGPEMTEPLFITGLRSTVVLVPPAVLAGSFHRVHLTEPHPPGVTRVPTDSRRLMVVSDLDVTKGGADDACDGALVKVAPVLTGEQNDAIDWADVEARLRAGGAAGVVIAPDVRKTHSQTKATRVGQAATVSAEAAIREWAGGMAGVPPDELEDATALSISLATAAGL